MKISLGHLSTLLSKTLVAAPILANVLASVATAQSPRPRSIGALGDSLTKTLPTAAIPLLTSTPIIHQLNDELGIPTDPYQDVWATDLIHPEIGSIAYRLSRLAVASTPLTTFNEAVVGAPSFTLSRRYRHGNGPERLSQLEVLANRAQAAGLPTAYPDLITIFIGANDLDGQPTPDRMTPTHLFATYIHEALDEIRSLSPHSRVVIALLPEDITRLDERIGNTPIRDGDSIFRSCRVFWDALHVNPNLTGRQENSTQRNAVLARVREYNAAIVDVVEDVEHTFGRGFVRVAQGTRDLRITPDLMSIDCFHPNWKGQAVIANAVASEISKFGIALGRTSYRPPVPRAGPTKSAWGRLLKTQSLPALRTTQP